MHLTIVDDAAALAIVAADAVEGAARKNLALVLALPTGETPTGLYAELARRRPSLSLRRARVFNLDEYVGLGPDDALSCGAFMKAHAYDPLDLDRARCHLPDTRAADLDGACAAYEAAIADAGGIDLAILGLGGNGHLGMNEPGAGFDGRTQVVTLAARSLTDNARLYPAGAKLPDRGITMGLGTIMAARRVLLLAFGARKADAIAATLEGPIDPSCPASVLRHHAQLTVIIDRAAAVGLRPR